MGTSIPVLGWVLIVFLVVFIVSINIGLFMGTKKKDNKDNWAGKLHAAGQTLKDPFRDENSRIQELSLRVEQLQKINKEPAEESAENSHSGDFQE